MNKICTKCEIEKDKSCFSIRKNKLTETLNSWCYECKAKARHNHYINNKEKELEAGKIYYQNVGKEKKHNNYIDNKDKKTTYNKKYYKDNKEAIAEQKLEAERLRTKNDPVFRLRKFISLNVRNMLLSNSASKNGSSILNHLEYTIEDLKLYIELLFSAPQNLDKYGNVWMNWDNHGIYKLETWNDDDSTTWVWNLDHIIPQSDLPYDSMDHPNFKKCWALENLRPYSAKQNIIDGANKTRHKNNKWIINVTER